MYFCVYLWCLLAQCDADKMPYGHTTVFGGATPIGLCEVSKECCSVPLQNAEESYLCNSSKVPQNVPQIIGACGHVSISCMNANVVQCIRLIGNSCFAVKHFIMSFGENLCRLLRTCYRLLTLLWCKISFGFTCEKQGDICQFNSQLKILESFQAKHEQRAALMSLD